LILVDTKAKVKMKDERADEAEVSVLKSISTRDMFGRDPDLKAGSGISNMYLRHHVP